MQITPGSLLVAHPKYAYKDLKNSVVFITESTAQSTMGILLNKNSEHTMSSLMQRQNIEWPWDMPVGTGGPFNTHALVMLHSDNWFSTNTMQTGPNFCMSSDPLMLEKLENGDHPEWYRLFMGCSGWTPSELAEELRGPTPKWLVLGRPSQQTVMMHTARQWSTAVGECSQNMFNSYF